MRKLSKMAEVEETTEEEMKEIVLKTLSYAADIRRSDEIEISNARRNTIVEELTKIHKRDGSKIDEMVELAVDNGLFTIPIDAWRYIATHQRMPNFGSV